MNLSDNDSPVNKYKTLNPFHQKIMSVSSNANLHNGDR